MTKNKILILLAIILLLGLGVFFNSGKSAGGDKAVAILSKVNGEDVSKITLQRGSESQSLAIVDNAWVVPSKDGYPANVSKIRALLLKLLDLKSSQTLKPSQDGLKKLGLDEEGVQSLYSKVVFFDKKGKEQGGLYIGKQRIVAPGEPAAGQYVRSIDSDTVYLISSPISINVAVDEWVESGILNVLSKNIYKVEQYSDDKLLFTLKRQGPISFYSNSGFVLDEESIPLGKELSEAAVSQITSGLENLRFSNVFLRENKKEFNLNNTTKYFLTSGFIYTVLSSEGAGDTVAAHFQVEFSQNLVDELKALEKEQQNEKMLKELDEQQVQQVKELFKALEFSSAEEAQAISSRYSKWIYEFPAFQGKKFRKTTEELLKNEEETK